MKEIIEMFQKEAKELEADMSVSCITSHPFVIQCGGLYISPEIKDKKTTGKLAWEVNPLRATRFTAMDARNIARTIVNGAGEIGEAVGIYQAVRNRHADVTRILDTMNAVNAL